MADLVTRLLLNSSQFDNNIRQSTQQVQQFQQVGRNITATIGRFAGVLGIAMTAGEAFNAAVNSSREAQQDWNTVVGTAKTTVDNFFSSLYSGDWTVFENGILNAIGLAKRYTEALSNAKMAMAIGESKADRLEAERNNYEYLITKKGISNEERTAAYNTYIELSKKEILERESKSKYFWEQIQEVMKAKGVTGINNAKEAQKLYESLLDPSTKEYADLEKYKQRKSDAKGTRNLGYLMMISGAGVGSEGLDTYTKGVKELEEATDESLENMIRFQNIFTSEVGEEVKDMLDKAITFTDKAGTIKRDMSDAGQDLKDGLNNGEVKLKPVIPTGSLAELDAQIASLRKELNLAISNEDRIRINAELNALTEQKRVIEFQYKYPNAPIGKLDGKPAGLAGIVKPEIPTSLPKFSSPITNKNIKLNNEYAESLGAIASIMGSVTKMTNEGAAAWLSWSANLISAVAAAIPQIVALTTAKKGEAIASGVASAAQTPFVGWLLAGAAAAAVVAALASIPSFSTGGIFAGNSTIGDMNLARVNAGEMILNNRQQRNLFNLLNGNGVMGSAGGGQVEFKIRGKELVGVLANYNNKTAKVR